MLIMLVYVDWDHQENIDNSFFDYVNQSFFLFSCETVFRFMVFPCKVWTKE